MKKIAILSSVVMMSISAMAQVVTVSQITLSSASQGDKILRVVAASQFSAGYDNGYDAIVGAGQDGGLYVILAGERYTKLAIDALPDNLPLGFGSVADTEYTLTFSNFSGASYTIYDRVANKTITVASSANIQIDGVDADPANQYSFTIDESEKNSQINDRFVINYNASTYVLATVTTNAYGWASFSYGANLEAVEGGLTIYKGAISGDVLNLADMDYVAANEGVIIYGTASTTYHFVAGTGSSDFTGNDIKPASAWASHSGTIFVLHDEALYQYTGSDMPANKAYLQISSGPNPAPKHIRMVVNGTTAIDNVEAESVKAEKFVENGQIFIRRGNEVYNLQGQQLR